MKKEQYWRVELTHASNGYNDETYYSIVNGNGEIIATDRDFIMLSEIANAHNKCFLAD